MLPTGLAGGSPGKALFSLLGRCCRHCYLFSPRRSCPGELPAHLDAARSWFRHREPLSSERRHQLCGKDTRTPEMRLSLIKAQKARGRVRKDLQDNMSAAAR